MTVAELEAHLRRRVDARATPGELVDDWLADYQRLRVEGCDGPDADMLLFQWSDGGATVDLTRQLMPDGDGDGPILQLHVTFSYPPGSAAGVTRGHVWCASVDELRGFREAVLGSAALRVLGGRAAERCEVWLEHAE